MKICTTKTRLTEEEALQLASRDNSGLIGTFFNKLGHVPKEVSVLQIRKLYYPYYLEAAEAKLLRAAGLPTRRVVYTVAMEGGFGTVQQMKGRPATSYEEVDPSAVVVCKIDKAGADANVAKFIKRRAYKIFHQYPQVSTLEAYVVYKPHYACLCQKGERRFFRILDAEIKDRNFMLDIKFRELTFMDKDAANDRIDPALFFPENSPAADEL